MIETATDSQPVQLPQKIVRLQKVSSVEFAQKAFELYVKGEPFVIDNPGGPSEQLPCELTDVVPKLGGGWLTLLAVNSVADSAAQIIFSSGTEGKAKAIVVSYRALANVVNRLNETMQVDASIREYVGVPVTYSFGLGRLRAIAAAGGSAYLPENNFDVTEITQLLKQDQINAISAVPTLWRVVLENSAKFQAVGHKVRWIEIGSQYMSGREKARLKELFPQAKIVQHYGLTEASRSTLLDISSTNEASLDSVGRIDQGVEIKLAADGRIMIRGDHLASGLIINGKVTPITDAEDWLVTADLGAIENEMLYYRGRADDIINCSGVKIDPDELQQRILSAADVVGEFAVCAVPNELRGQGVFIATTAKEDQAQLRRLADQSLQAFGLQATDAIHAGLVKSIPKTATGKVQRKRLAEQFTPEPKATRHDGGGVLGLFREYFGPQVSLEDTFKTLGGDSLRYVQVGSRLEDLIGVAPAGWEGLPLQQLAALETQAPVKVARVEVTVFLRAVAILAVVVIHAGVESLFGATVLLFMLVGYNFARFQTDTLVAGDHWPKIAKFIGVTLIPYYAFAALFMLAEKQLNVPLLLLYENFVGNQLTLIFPFWFVQQLTQCLLLIGLVFSLPINKAWLAENISRVSKLACIVVVVATLLFQWILQPASPLSGWPIASYLAVFTIGWAFFHAETLPWRIAVAVMGVLVASVAYGWHSKTGWMTLGCLSLAFFSSVYTTAFLRKVVEVISASTLYLFVTNGMVIYVLMKIIGPQPWVLAPAALVVGVGSWYLYERSGLKQKFII